MDAKWQAGRNTPCWCGPLYEEEITATHFAEDEKRLIGSLSVSYHVSTGVGIIALPNLTTIESCLSMSCSALEGNTAYKLRFIK